MGEKWNGLTLAVDHTLTDLITQLFEKGADPNVRTSNNKTALAVAVTAQFKSGGQDDTEMIECLLDNGAEVDVKFVQDNTILHLAVLVQHTGLVKSLINHGANTALMNAKKDTPMMMAFKYRKDDAFQLLKHSAAVGTVHPHWDRPSNYQHVAVPDGTDKIIAVHN